MIVTTLAEVEARPRRLAVGTFDGVHHGHREVISGSDTVVTFDPHPASVVPDRPMPALLTTTDVKAELIAALGVQELVLIPFDADFAARSAQRFIDDVLVGALNARRVSVGENFRFGHRAQGTAHTLAADERFEARIVPLVEIDGERVSSGRIRALLAAGDVLEARLLLGAPFQVRGRVVHGEARGRLLGFPTANLIPDARIVNPGHGVYAALADGKPAAVNIGVRPTFADAEGELIEAHLIDFDGDLYGRELRLEFLERLRSEQRFETSAALVEQMRRDVDTARAVCERAGAVPTLRGQT